MRVPFLDLGEQFRQVKAELGSDIMELLESGAYVLGRQVAAFEDEFADYIGVAHAIGVSNGTDGLRLALQAVGVGPGDEVIAPLHTFKASVAAILATGATPVLVDMNRASMTASIDDMLSAITPATRAIMPVHMHGYPYPVQDLRTSVDSLGRGILFIEDASQAHGACIDRQRVGSLGEVGVFSLYPGKNLGAAGDAGVCVTDSSEIAQRIRDLRNWIDVPDLDGPRGRAWNCRLDEVQALILRAKLRHLDEWNEQRQAQAAIYFDSLPEGIVWPQDRSGSVFHHVLCLVPSRDRVRHALDASGIQTGIHYATPMSQTVLAETSRLPMGSVNADWVASRTLSLPVGPHLTTEQVRFVASALQQALAGS